MTPGRITYGYWCTCSSFAQRAKAVWCSYEGKTTTIPTIPVTPLQAGSLRSGSISHLNKHGPAEDGGEFFRGVKETAPLNETIEAGEFSDTVAWLGFTRVLNKCWCCVWTLKFVTESVGVAPLPNRLWCLSYRDTMNHLSSAYLLWTACWDIIGSETTNEMVIILKPGLLTCHSFRLRCLLLSPLFTSYKVYEIEAFWFAGVQ